LALVNGSCGKQFKSGQKNKIYKQGEMWMEKLQVYILALEVIYTFRDLVRDHYL
jgi:hypothetical protein